MEPRLYADDLLAWFHDEEGLDAGLMAAGSIAEKLALGTSEEAATAAPEYLIKLRRSMAFTFFGILGLQTE